MGSFGGSYEALSDERGFTGSKVGGQLTLALLCEIPVCRGCGKPMRFLLQLSLGRGTYEPYRMAVVLVCPGPLSSEPQSWCGTNEPDSGCNAVILLNEVVPAEPSGPLPGFGISGARVSPPHRILWESWPDFFRQPSMGGSRPDEDGQREFDEVVAFEDRFGLTKLGGYPLYIYSDTEPPSCPACGGETTFIASFDAGLGGRDENGARCLEEFGDCGAGYLFLCDARCSDRGGAFLWQCS